MQARIQKRLLLHPGVDDIIAVGGHVEHIRVRLEGDHGAGFLRRPHHPHGLGDLAPGELHLIDLAVLVDLDLQPFAQGVDHAGAHAVEAAGDLVAPAAELAAGVEHGENHLQGGQARLGLDVHGDAAAVVGDSDGVALVDGDGDLIAEAGQGLVDGVVHDLVDQVVQSRFAGGADIHARPLAHGLQALQHLDLAAAVLMGHLVDGQLGFFHYFRHFFIDLQSVCGKHGGQALQPPKEGGRGQRGDVDPLPRSRRGAHHQGFWQIAAGAHHHPFLLRRPEIGARVPGGGGVVQIEYANNVVRWNGDIVS